MPGPLRLISGLSIYKPHIDARRINNEKLLVLTGEILLDDGDLAFRRCIHDRIDRGEVKILVDLAAVTYIDSSGIGMMAAKLKTVRDKGGDIRIVSLNTRGQAATRSRPRALRTRIRRSIECPRHDQVRRIFVADRRHPCRAAIDSAKRSICECRPPDRV